MNNGTIRSAKPVFKNEQHLAWDDARVVLAVQRAGSLTGAAAQLGISHPTVFRRVRDLEAAFGVRLFDRSRAGYAATAAGEAIAAVAAEMEERFTALERRLQGADLRPAGSVRITTTDTLLTTILPGVFRAFRDRFPEITLDLVGATALADLSRREADIAIRPGGEPPAHLVGRRLGDMASAIYAPRAASPSLRLDAASWIAPDDSLSHLASYRWIQAAHAGRVVVRANSLLHISHAIRAGLGVGILPCYLGDHTAGLRRLGRPLPELTSPFWLLTHPDLRRVVRIRAVMDWIPRLLEPHRALLAGR